MKLAFAEGQVQRAKRYDTIGQPSIHGSRSYREACHTRGLPSETRLALHLLERPAGRSRGGRSAYLADFRAGRGRRGRQGEERTLELEGSRVTTGKLQLRSQPRAEPRNDLLQVIRHFAVQFEMAAARQILHAPDSRCAQCLPRKLDLRQLGGVLLRIILAVGRDIQLRLVPDGLPGRRLIRL